MKNLLVKIFSSLILFTIIIVTVITFVNRQILVQDLKLQTQESRALIEDHILADMYSVDRAYFYLDKNYSESMETELYALREYYESNPDVYSWDAEEIKKRTGMHFYVIDEKNKVIISTYEPSLGLEFSECCVNFAALLDDRRASGEFYSDGIDISAVTNGLWRYSYLPTKDHKYILELGFELKNSPLYESFNFLKTADDLVHKYEDLNNVKIIGDEGLFLGAQDGIRSVNQLSPALKEAYYKAYETSEKVEIQTNSTGKLVETHQFIPYFSENQLGNSTKRVIYIEYNNNTELKLLDKNTKQFWFTLAISLVTASILLLIIIKIISNTIRLATFDSLTGVYNRTSYLQYMERLTQRKGNARLGLLLVDLDNFKQVNDQLGHLKGDEVLKQMAKALRNIVGNEGHVVRFGGDEFAIIIENANEEKLSELANHILQHVRSNQREYAAWELLSVSIGGTLQQEPQEEEKRIFERGDQALYVSKNKGKDQYTFN